MKYALEKVSEDVETKEHVLVLKETEGEDLLALNIEKKEADVLALLMAPADIRMNRAWASAGASAYQCPTWRSPEVYGNMVSAYHFGFTVS